MSDAQGYASPGAFRRALTDRLREAARDSRWTLQQLQRQLAYDRLLERLYLEDRGWILKGATALLARGLGVRATVDIDVFRDAAREIAESELRRAAARDTGDWFRFEVGPARAVADAAAGLRLPITARIGPTPWATFHVDIVGADVRMTGDPEDVPALAWVGMSQVPQHGYRAYPLHRGYAAEARRSLLQRAWTLEDALEIVRPFLNPLLARSATGRWDPASRGWGRSFTLGNQRLRRVVHERAPGLDAVRARRGSRRSSGSAAPRSMAWVAELVVDRHTGAG